MYDVFGYVRLFLNRHLSARLADSGHLLEWRVYLLKSQFRLKGEGRTISLRVSAALIDL